MSLRWIIILVIGGMGLTTLLTVFYLAPKAIITLTAKISQHDIEQRINLSGDIDLPDFQKLTLPTRTFEHQAEATITVERSGDNPKNDFAKGIVSLTNDQNNDQIIFAHSHLLHVESGAQFLTDQEVKIPAHGTVDVLVTAKQDGPSGNVAPGTFVVEKIPVELQQLIHGRSNAPFTGGVIVDNPLSEEEIAAALTRARDQAIGNARQEIQKKYFDSSIREDLLTVEVNEEGTSANTGSYALSFTANSKITIKGFSVEDSDILALTLVALRNTAEQAEELLSYNPESMNIEIMQANFETKTAIIKVKLTGNFGTNIDTMHIPLENLINKRPEEAASYLEQLEQIQQASVELSPFWVRKIPSRSKAIELKLENGK